MKWLPVLLTAGALTACATSSSLPRADAKLAEQSALCSRQGGVLTPDIGVTNASAYSCNGANRTLERRFRPEAR